MPGLPTTWREALHFFATLQPSTIKLGLERMARALEALGHPEQEVPALHVAGTNGKGSTCAFAASALRAQGYRVGLYTSPHLERVNERVQVDGREISDEAFGTRVLELLEAYPAAAEELTYFEFATLLAFWHFAHDEVDLAVLETGLGGRLDATRLCVPLVTAVTAISLDHVEYLGSTEREIAGEKAGIFKEGVPVVTCAQSPAVTEVLRERARALQAPFFQEGPDFSLRPGPVGLRFEGPTRSLEPLTLGLRGAHQRSNAAIAVQCLELLGPQGFPVSDEALRRGLAEARWPGRLEEISQGPTVLLDGAHNPAGVLSLVQALEALYAGRELRLVFAVLRDKDYGPMMEALVPRALSVYLPTLQNPRALAPAAAAAEIQARVRQAPPVKTFDSTAAALEAARLAAGPEGLVLVAGSLVLIGEARQTSPALLGGPQSRPVD